MNVDQKNNKKLSKVLSTKLSTDDYNLFLILTKLEHQAGLIEEESRSELLRSTIQEPRIRWMLRTSMFQPV